MLYTMIIIMVATVASGTVDSVVSEIEIDIICK